MTREDACRTRSQETGIEWRDRQDGPTSTRPLRPDSIAGMAHVQTVLGPIPPETLGFTLPHEHTQIALWHVPARWDYWQLTRDEPVILAELARFSAAGGSGLVDLTTTGVGRDPEWLRAIAIASGLHIVMGCGWYRLAYYPAETGIDRRSVDDLADELVLETTLGVGETGVRPGIIGEIGTDKPWVSPAEERVHRAVARASRRTGLAITTHGVMSAVGLAQLSIFEEEGADPARVIVGHADSYPVLDHHLEIARRGANLEFDFLGMTFNAVEKHGEPRVIELLLELLSRGHVDRILLSQDVCHDAQLKRYEGNGYVYLSEVFLPRLRAAGVSDADIATMTVDNPRRLLTIA
jgi:predicted metal-dependent phosphotriesterase family hydrolase